MLESDVDDVMSTAKASQVVVNMTWKRVNYSYLGRRDVSRKLNSRQCVLLAQLLLEEDKGLNAIVNDGNMLLTLKPVSKICAMLGSGSWLGKCRNRGDVFTCEKVGYGNVRCRELGVTSLCARAVMAREAMYSLTIDVNI